MILMFAQEGTKKLTHKEAQIILKQYVQRNLPYQTLNTVRSNYLQFLYGELTMRLHMFPAFLRRLEEIGHHVEYGTVNAAKMKEYTIASAENLHKLK